MDVARDFLTGLYQHTIATLWKQHQESLMAITRVDFVLTVPAVWSDAAKEREFTVPRLAPNFPTLMNGMGVMWDRH
jgi:hypothetical protein